MEQIINVAIAKRDKFLEKTFKSCVKTVIGTALSIGATVEGQSPKAVQIAIDKGEYDNIIKEGS